MKSMPWNEHYFQLAGIVKKNWLAGLDLALIDRDRFLGVIFRNKEDNRTRFFISELEI